MKTSLFLTMVVLSLNLASAQADDSCVDLRGSYELTSVDRSLLGSEKVASGQIINIAQPTSCKEIEITGGLPVADAKPGSTKITADGTPQVIEGIEDGYAKFKFTETELIGQYFDQAGTLLPVFMSYSLDENKNLKIVETITDPDTGKTYTTTVSTRRK